ncbi:hypothetical protein [Streptomyces albicerus]|uniref:hypothetical protein n=1 Tax=Streptomyces albicerus TaxID=2569859 RepID=UPI00124BAF18|nr:hypothetical protein [Streptomyces albicerus]
MQVVTADADSADTRGRVFLGLGGREFRLAKDGGEFDRGVTTTFKLGASSNVAHSAANDPRAPQLDLADLTRYPVYVRLEEAGSEPQWLLERITLTVNPGTATATEFDNLHLAGLEAGHKIWLGADQGTILHLAWVRSAAAGWPFNATAGVGTVLPPEIGQTTAGGGQATDLNSGLPHGLQQTAPHLKESPVLTTPLDQPYIIAVENSLQSNYLRPDNLDDNTGQLVQIWNKDVIREVHKAAGETMQWHLVRHDNSTYSLLSNPQHNALTLDTDGEVRLRARTNSSNQRWLLTPVPGLTGNTYVIRPFDQPEYALIRENDSHDTYVKPKRMWGGLDGLFAWHVTPAPEDMRRQYPLPEVTA